MKICYTASYLHTIFSYSEGKLYWKVRSSQRVKIGQEAGCPDEDGYIVIRLDGERYRRTQLVWAMHQHDSARWPDYVRHVNGRHDDDRIENLEGRLWRQK